MWFQLGFPIGFWLLMNVLLGIGYSKRRITARQWLINSALCLGGVSFGCLLGLALSVH